MSRPRFKVKGRLVVDPTVKERAMAAAQRNYELYGELGARVCAAVLSYRMGEALSTTYRRNRQDLDLIGAAWVERGKRLLVESENAFFKKLSEGVHSLHRDAIDLEEEEAVMSSDEGEAPDTWYVISQHDVLRLENLVKRIRDLTGGAAKEPLTWSQSTDAWHIVASVVSNATLVEIEEAVRADGEEPS